MIVGSQSFSRQLKERCRKTYQCAKQNDKNMENAREKSRGMSGKTNTFGLKDGCSEEGAQDEKN